MVLKNRTYNHLGLLLDLFPSDFFFLFKIIQPIEEIYIGNSTYRNDEIWEPRFHIKANVTSKSLIIIKDLKKKNLIDYYKDEENIMLVFPIPQELHKIIYHWLRGEYSLMLSKQQQLKLSKESRKRKFDAYNKIGNYSELFIEYIMKSFNMEEKDKHYINTENLNECDIAPLLKEETLHFNNELKKKVIEWHDTFKKNIENAGNVENMKA